MVDAIVFNQDELYAALGSGAKHIILCDNRFRLPEIDGISYAAIGDVKAFAEFDSSEVLGITFENFTPTLKKRPKIVHISNKAVGLTERSSYSSSYASSYVSSYKFSYTASYTTSYTTSYRYNYEYEYEYRTSFSGSYTTSYRLSESYKTSFTSSLVASFVRGFKRRGRVIKEISVNGYGIHLI